MRSVTNHIISRFSWDTSFDRKETAFELQERISRWSRLSMPRELNGVFDKLCPPEQTWRIRSLEIDLGEVDFNNLEFDLSRKLKQKLRESLTDLIIRDNQDLQSIEVIDEDVSQLELVRHFLFHGLMPWNYRETYGSVNEILSTLLQSNHEEIIALIKEMGATRENVRKRIAWQVNESNIVKIIAGLEPNYYDQVIEYSHELIKVQEKEPVVKTSVRDLKKNIWLWVLNFLLTERGTLFNKVAFMKSMLKQMAATHNISYDELFNLLETAVDKLGKRLTIKVEFIVVLKLLSKETKPQQDHSVVIKDIDYWQLLENYFRNPQLRSNADGKVAFNELLISLRKQNSVRLRKLLLSSVNDEKRWQSVVNDLQEGAFGIIIAVINPADASVLLKTIGFINELVKNASNAGTLKLIQCKALQFLQKNNGSFNRQAFAAFCTTALIEKRQIAPDELFSRLVNKRASSAEKTLFNLELFKTFGAVFTDQATIATALQGTGYFEKTIQALVAELYKGDTEKQAFISLQKSASKFIRLYPDKAFTVFAAYADKDILSKLLVYVTDNSTVQSLIKSAGKKYNDILLWIEQVFSQLKSASINHHTTWPELNESLFTTALDILIVKPDISEDEFIKAVFEKLCISMPLTQLQQFSAFVGKQEHAPDLDSQNISPAVLAKMHEGFYQQHLSVVDRVQYIISSSGNRQRQLSKMLAANFNDSEFVSLRADKNAQSSPIINYLLPGGGQLMTRLVRKYSRILLHILGSASEAGIIRQLTEIYWQCLVNYDDYNGNTALFKRSFGATVMYRYPGLYYVSNASQQEIDIAIDRIDHLLDQIPNRQGELIKLLINNGFSHTGIHSLLGLDDTKRAAIACYLLTDGTNFQHELVKEYTRQLLRKMSLSQQIQYLPQLTPDEINKQLNELFWECLLKYQQYNGNAAQFKKLYQAMVQLRYPVLVRAVTNVTSSQQLAVTKSNYYRLKNRDDLPVEMLLVYIQQCIQTYREYISVEGKEYHLDELLGIALEEEPAKLKALIAGSALTDEQVKLLYSSVPFNVFSLWIATGAGSSVREEMDTIRLLYDVIAWFVKGEIKDELVIIYWKQALKLLSNKTPSASDIKKLVTDSFSFIAANAGLNVVSIVTEMYKGGFTITPSLHSILVKYLPGFSTGLLDTIIAMPGEKLVRAHRDGLLDSLINAVMVQQQIPSWYATPNETDIQSLLNEILMYHPAKFMQVIRREIITERQMHWLGRSVSFKTLLAAISSLNRSQQSALYAIGKLYQSFGNFSINGISTGELQYILLRKVIKAWITGHWNIISAKNIWNELLWEVCTVRGIGHKVFIQQVENIKLQLPPSLQVSFGFLKKQDTDNAGPKIEKVIAPAPRLTTVKAGNEMRVLVSSIMVKNAGIVLLNGYIPLLFERLGLISNKKFVTPAAQMEAVHYLQYVITGLSRTDESLLTLNKILCGLPLSEPVQDSINISPDNIKLIDGLITAIIGHWPVIGRCSVNGFRGNWLVRDGLLVEQDDKWEITVEKRAYDILINKAPFSFSIIKYAWMAKPLHVHWAY